MPQVSTPSSPSSLEDPNSPAAAAQKSRANRLARLFQSWKHEHPTLVPIPFPTISEIAQERSPLARAKLHGQLLLGMYQIDFKGNRVSSEPVPSLLYDYLVEILSYLCEKKVGIVVHTRPVQRSFWIGSGPNPVSPKEWRDATWAMYFILGYERQTFRNPSLPHRYILQCYLNSGYISDDLALRLVAPVPTFATWAETAAFFCRPETIAELISAGIDMNSALTSRVLQVKRSSLKERFGPGVSVYRKDRYRALDDVAPGDFLQYFKICGHDMETDVWESISQCVEVVKAFEASRMNNLIESVVKSAPSATPSGPAASSPRRRSMV